MRSKFSFSLLGILILSIMAISLSSCLTYKQIVNFQDGEVLDSGYIDSISNFYPLKLQPDDVLQVIVSSFETEEARRFNTMMGGANNQQMGGGGGGGINVSEPFGYRVDSKGFVEMPVVGKVYLKDKTLEEARDEIARSIEATGYLKEFSLQIRYLTFRVTILGEVTRPGSFTVPNSRMTILEAVGLAGDVGIFSNRDNILIIREKDGERVYGRVNLKSKDIFNSPYYYLKPNDIVYVEPHKSKILSTPDPVSRYIGTIIAFTTLITLFITLFNN